MTLITDTQIYKWSFNRIVQLLLQVTDTPFIIYVTVFSLKETSTLQVRHFIYTFSFYLQ